ncbi:cysteine-rich and transmembrane domain-containing protein B-like [Asparagus officinalis]|uniref:cysteine-rich and transmembrane domain-containing protein B-like n=1 Tax=Asparagus officinalis TaxID=4686 RepID=UPI00098DF303|nr:cysteine-rich and transmembrane domain-containing protein B-like [Asparagus officinalis]
MSSYNQQQAPTAETNSYPPQGQAFPGYVAPPPLGYPVKDGAVSSQQVPVQTKSRGDDDDGFLKGCCAALCCCCVLDTCF